MLFYLLSLVSPIVYLPASGEVGSSWGSLQRHLLALAQESQDGGII